MERLAERLKAARAERGLSLEAAARPAAISTAYLHKLEGGRVGNPSPRVLERVAAVLGCSYWELMELAGYVPGEERERMKSDGAPKATNAEIVRLLGELRGELAELRKALERLSQPSR
jgi:transcriptional regulator with XRE-family HTH domain